MTGEPDQTSTRAATAFIALQSLVLSIGLVLITGMLSAAAAFAQGITISIPFVAAFHGYAEADGSQAVSMTGSWVGALLLVAALTTALTLLIIAAARGRAPQSRKMSGNSRSSGVPGTAA